MRSFVIQRIGLTLGPPGSHVFADEMRMDDDQLDAFVEAGYAVEVHNGPARARPDDTPDTPLDALAPKPKKKAAPKKMAPKKAAARKRG